MVALQRISREDAMNSIVRHYCVVRAPPSIFASVATRPNILWIVTTQWRAQACGYAGDPNARTPWIDAMASQAINYVQAITPHPFGPQARAALLTGKLCPENGVRSYWDPLPIGARTIAHEMCDRGYKTAFFGKWHLANRDPSVALVGNAHAKMIVPEENRGGFDLWEGFESGFLINDPWLHGTRLREPTHFLGYQADVLVDRAMAWLNRNEGAPKFCLLSMEPPHPPYRAAAPKIEPSDPASLSLRGNVPIGGAVEPRARADLSGYYAHIGAIDRALGRLLSGVEIAETATIFTSVHGDMHGSHGVFRKAWPYEESLRVPLLVRYPDAAGHSDNAMIGLEDLLPMSVAISEGRRWESARNEVAISMPSVSGFPDQCPYQWKGTRSASKKMVSLVNPVEGSRLNTALAPWLEFDLVSDPLELSNLV